MNTSINKLLAAHSLEALGLDSKNIQDLKTFFTSDAYFQHRTVKGGRVLGGGSSLNIVEFIYHELLTVEQRREIFVSEYEIGHPDRILSNSEQIFFDYLELRYGGSAEDTTKELKTLIKELTGNDFKSFVKQDRSTAYKVLTLLYRVSRQDGLKLFSFLTKGYSGEAWYEYRSAYPYQTEKSIRNSAVLAELLTQLTFSMPLDYRKKSVSILDNIETAGSQMAVYARSEVEGYTHNVGGEGKYSPSNFERGLKELTNTVTPSRQISHERIDFMLYSAITLREYGARVSSNKQLIKLVYETPLSLNTLYKKKLNSFVDSCVIPYLLGKKDLVIKEKYNSQAKFIAQLFFSNSIENQQPLKPLNMQIIKALIIHDEKLDIHIPTKVIGDRNIPTSVSAVLKKGIKILKQNGEGKSFNFNQFPEVLLNYWFMRMHYANRVLFAKDMEADKKSEAKIAELDLSIDESLITFLSNHTLAAYQELEQLPDRFAQNLGYQIGKATRIDA